MSGGPGAIESNAAVRVAVMARVRSALGVSDDRAAAQAAAASRLAARPVGPRPTPAGDPIERFAARALELSSTVERLARVEQVPSAVARYLESLDLAPALAAQRTRRGVCWPELGTLDWTGAGLEMEPRPARGDDRLGVTGAFCAIAETGTLVLVTGAATPSSTMILPDTHIAVLRADRIVEGMEEAYALLRDERASMPRGVHFVSGPSRTGDIEQTIVLGAHGPFRVHVVVVD